MRYELNAWAGLADETRSGRDTVSHTFSRRFIPQPFAGSHSFVAVPFMSFVSNQQNPRDLYLTTAFGDKPCAAETAFAYIIYTEEEGRKKNGVVRFCRDD